jgi:hypothetical protein
VVRFLLVNTNTSAPWTGSLSICIGPGVLQSALEVDYSPTNFEKYDKLRFGRVAVAGASNTPLCIHEKLDNVTSKSAYPLHRRPHCRGGWCLR